MYVLIQVMSTEGLYCGQCNQTITWVSTNSGIARLNYSQIYTVAAVMIKSQSIHGLVKYYYKYCGGGGLVVSMRM